MQNPWGLYDMPGNVWKWCEDWYNSNKGIKVVSGGSWLDAAGSTHSAGRYDGFGVNRSVGIGFRLLRTLLSWLGAF